MESACGIGLMRLLVVGLMGMSALRSEASAPVEGGRKGSTIYVSKLGDNTDGKSWKTAFKTIQAALSAVPDDKGGHRIVIRPDHYMEALLNPAHKGAPGAYNVLVADFDGSNGSGATGYAIIDSGDPQKGHKSIDWWGTGKCDPNFSCIGWDRWLYRHLYTCGAEGAGWDLTCEKGAPFSGGGEDCFAVGRFSGYCIGAFTGRPNEPVIFRRTHSWALDWWGDAAGMYIRAENKKMPDCPDVVLEDCTLVGPDNALQAGNPGFDGNSHVDLKNCRLVSLNFSQPHGQPSTGVIYSTLKGKHLKVDLEDCFLMGCKVFGAGGRQFGMTEQRPDGGPIPYTTKGICKAYVQFQQEVPKGFVRVGEWPVEVFSSIMPPQLAALAGAGRSACIGRPELTKIPLAMGPAMENTPVVYKGRPLIVMNHRDDTKNNTDHYTKSMYLYIKDLCTGNEIGRFAEGHSFANAFVNGDELHVFASEGTNRDWFKSIYHFTTTDLKNWKREPAIPLEGDEHLFNCSVCRDDQGYLMAYESNKPVMFCFKFARSKDLSKWEKVPGLIFTGINNEYSACPVIRYFAPYYYVIYLHAAIPGHNGWVSFLARSQDLARWELSPYNPILEAGVGEGVNNSDVDLFEWQGKTYFFYATGDQQTWGTVRVAIYPGPMKQFYEGCFPTGVPMLNASARR